MTTLHIPVNKLNIAFRTFLLLFSIISAVILCYVLFLNGKFSFDLILVLLIGLPVLVFILWFSIHKLVSKKPGLILDSRGILDNVDFTDIGVISWHEITEIKLVKYHYSFFLVVYLKNNEMVLNRLNGFKKKNAQNFLENFGSPFCINVSNLKIDKMELLKIISSKI
jgi:hypothetical protein